MVFSLSFQKKYLIFPESKQRLSETRANTQKKKKKKMEQNATKYIDQKF